MHAEIFSPSDELSQTLSSIDLNSAYELGHEIGSEYNRLRLRLEKTTNSAEIAMLSPLVEKLKAQRDQVLKKITELELVYCT